MILGLLGCCEVGAAELLFLNKPRFSPSCRHPIGGGNDGVTALFHVYQISEGQRIRYSRFVLVRLSSTRSGCLPASL